MLNAMLKSGIKPTVVDKYTGPGTNQTSCHWSSLQVVRYMVPVA